MKMSVLCLTLCALAPSLRAADPDALAEMNAITRTLEWDRLSPSLSALERDRLTRRREEVRAQWIATLPAPAPSPVATIREKHRRPRPSRAIQEGDRVDAKTVMAKAGAARESGRLETALRLYRAAASLPGGEAAAGPVGELEAELGDQPER